MPNTDDAQSRKEAVADFLQMVVAGRIDAAYAKYVDMTGKQHNPYFAAGFAALRQAMLDDYMQSPSKQIVVKHVLGDGDLVAAHSQLLMGAGQPSMSVVHIFRFQGAKIVELWDIGQQAPAESPNTDGMF